MEYLSLIGSYINPVTISLVYFSILLVCAHWLDNHPGKVLSFLNKTSKPFLNEMSSEQYISFKK